MSVRLSSLSLILALVSSPLVWGETYTFDLTDINEFDLSASTGSVNLTAGRIQSGAEADGTELDYGDGSDGAFNDGPTQSGITGGGASFTINTDVKSEFNFTTFNISGGVTVSVTGSQPLVIRVLGDATIAGTLAADGEAGSAASAGGAGGSGVAGGFSGGNGGIQSSSTLATFGQPAASTYGDGGDAGPSDDAVDTNVQGGGGGCFGTNDAGTGTGGGATPAGDCSGTTPNATATAFDTDGFVGGSGGGGGGHSLAPFDGAGGGGGGGAIRIVASGGVSATGAVSVNGGAGGSGDTGAAATTCSGAGGGGSGGSIWVQCHGTAAGTYNLVGGAGGTEPTCGIYTGGAGGTGVLRRDSSAGAIGEDYSAAAFNYLAATVVTAPVDLSNGYYALSNGAFTKAGNAGDGVASVFFEGSMDGTDFDASTAVTPAQISQLSDFPYIRARVELEVLNPTGDPEYITALSFDRELINLTDIRLNGSSWCAALGWTTVRGSGPRSGNDDGPHVAFSAAWARAVNFILPWMVLLLAWGWMRRRTATSVAVA
jgi:hypothetical protein